MRHVPLVGLMGILVVLAPGPLEAARFAEPILDAGESNLGATKGLQEANPEPI
jgi:hypothetical protein